LLYLSVNNNKFLGSLKMREFDFIVVGGGSTGGVVAARLAENPNVSVALLEEGPSDWYPWVHIPGMLYKTATGGLLRHLEYNRSDESNSAATATVQGQVLGGGSSVNGMVHVRGVPQDYDRWEALGAVGWSFQNVLPFFLRAEGNDTYRSAVHQGNGPLKVSNPRVLHPLSRAWVQACQEAGMPFNPDFNSGEQLGCGFYQTATHNGRRSSVARAYIHPAVKQHGLTVLTNCRVEKVIFEGKKAAGVAVTRDGRQEVLRARHEIVLSAGALNTPRLLMLSGIGPADHLRQAGVEVIADAPGVGENLQDHMDVYLIYKLGATRSYDRYKSLPMKLAAGTEYALFRNGPAASNIIEGGAFWWARKDDTRPTIQYCFLPGTGVESGVTPLHGADGCTLNICLTQPDSRGSLRLNVHNPSGKSVITPNFLSHEQDMLRMIEGVRVGLEIMAQPSISQHISSLHQPSKPFANDAEIASYVRRYAQGALHPVGTCRMGTDDEAVVDPQLRVYGVEGLRVADASVMPTLPSGNTNAACIMIGERAAHVIKVTNKCSETAISH